ncbi:MAG: LacI family DNA-binding transcriptional regulator [Castellaniella sp.]|uniref:LacI family DNA-binding transcriptional regulator n=1 Tax=Castellaniella sp. TaxID=1955812 RepID=UPI003C766BEE
MRNPTEASRSLVTIKDIASELGVSNATVSRALGDSPLISLATKERIRAKATEMGYVPDAIARMMRGEASNLVGFILPDVQNHFYSAMARALAENVATIGLQLVLAISEGNAERELRHVRELRRARARGIIITPVADMRSETAELLSAGQTVQLVRSHPLVQAASVSADDGEATRLSTSHLLSLGHRRIAYLGGGSEILDSGVRRLSGYRSAMASVAGTTTIERLTAPHPENGYQAAQALMAGSERPTALVLGSSQLALGALHAIREMGLRIPQDISLLSYDDPDWLQLCGPGISTIALPIQSMAHYAVSLIDAHYRPAGLPTPCLTEHAGTGTHYAFPVSLVERGSCSGPIEHAVSPIRT